MSSPPVLSYRSPTSLLSRFVPAYAWLFAAFFFPLAAATVSLFYIVPKFKQIFQDFRTTLPLATQWALNLAAFVVDYWFIAVPLLLLVMLALPVTPALYVARGGDLPTRRRRMRVMIWLALLLSFLLGLTGLLTLLLPLIKLIQSVSGGGP